MSGAYISHGFGGCELNAWCGVGYRKYSERNGRTFQVDTATDDVSYTKPLYRDEMRLMPRNIDDEKLCTIVDKSNV
ncbi:hypothetical protein H257_18349 [Aphanomyces astaci]|uniref:Uncharacterized protein n=1 Tax=Aphanomyces astaci TaxID=112090 RepID=W4FDM2_APHAT|nr:hypothetical protein H257_18349 [Aphanomyces astaci]ETV64833.1 hypothetical protein H257_18349 [Aphanomyces astaci]|eukprot:XP_009845690.1 hypothetical protein H257_18349 [Aphanomyces astaci]